MITHGHFYIIYIGQAVPYFLKYATTKEICVEKWI